ncbi:reverse transcriptase domain-containing protein [Nodularia sp. NIES-3585]|uniref:reverse transcriptase domain-containing protein n=1 Tax=Nodularia sp. NIES-3585 TaxID=1973477 RepID=UPI000B5C4D45|nr:reverse transcriptase domain-containing protein [Nodularia sp. NIES-3585]GAX35000.1 RNA-dependent DNA polymerase [Nodularia sp. NIES-3585]
MSENYEKKSQVIKALKPCLDKNCDELIKKFYSLKSGRDVARLLEVPYGDLVYYLYVIPYEQRYTTFQIPKKLGGYRIISTPATSLKLIQKKLNQVLQCVYQVKPSVHGFVKDKNIVTNAKAHIGKRYVLNFDLKDFFVSINFGRVRGMFMALPYALNPEVATVIAQICCHDNQLPQGAPTSPIVSNMLCAKLDSQFQKLAKKYRFTYTRYADDITFSTTRPNLPEEIAYIIITEEPEKLEKVVLGKDIYSIVKENSFEVNQLKVRIQNDKQHQEVTSITVNTFPNVDRNYIRQIRAMIHAWEKFGLESSELEYINKYEFKARLFSGDTPKFKQVLRGKIEFLGMVKGKNDTIYKKYLTQYLELNKRDKNFFYRLFSWREGNL